MYPQANRMAPTSGSSQAQRQFSGGARENRAVNFIDWASAHGDLLSVVGSDIWITVAPAPVGPLLPVVQLNESTLLVALGLVPLVRAVFIAVPGVIVLVAPVVVAFVVLAVPVFLVPVVSVLGGGSGHHRNRGSKGGSQKK
jgi:hypothetical protein